MISAQNPQAGPQTDRGFQLVWGGWDFCFLLKLEFTGVGPKADEWLASESELVTFHPGDLTVIRWTSGGTWSDIREGLLRNFITLGRQNSAFQDWESLPWESLAWGALSDLPGCLQVLASENWCLSSPKDEKMNSVSPNICHFNRHWLLEDTVKSESESVSPSIMSNSLWPRRL